MKLPSNIAAWLTSRRLALFLAALFALLATFAAPPPAHGQGVAGDIMLVNVKTEKCLTISGGQSPANNVEAVQFRCDEDPSRRWTLVEKGGRNVYQVKNLQTGKCLTIAGGISTANSVPALQFDCDDHPSRTWRISDVTGSGIHQLRNVQTNKCLTIAGGESSADSLGAVQFDCDTHPSRRWILRLKL